MIDVHFSRTCAEAGQIVLAALRRSVSVTQARFAAQYTLRAESSPILVAVDVSDATGEALADWLRSAKGKLIVFGRLPAALASLLGCERRSWPEGFELAARSAAAATYATSRSRSEVRYGPLCTQLNGGAWVRPFERFDFTDEWNNLGYGAIRADGSIWSVREPIDAPERARLASVHVDGERQCSYAALWDLNASSVLWFNRAVGPCDSFEWRLVENFLSAHRADELPCQPVLGEIPWGYDAAVTSRLDCDEDVESARPLWRAYQSLGVPFSLAVHTSNLHDSAHHRILRELDADPSCAIYWGGSYDAAIVEGGESARLLEEVTGKAVRYAVSPFHQSPHYALEALADLGYAGCVGGIIRNDPEFLLARGGSLAGMPEGFVGHSQQCMLHGDCLLADANPLSVFEQAFDLAYETRTLFGYLDHPFSERYQYGWSSEDARIEAHERLIAYIRRRAQHPVFLNENAALDFLRAKSLSRVVETDGSFYVQSACDVATDLRLAVEFRGNCAEVVPGGRLL
jgi:hypothetical protein